MKLKTTSDQAAKLYDASMAQFVGWYHDNSLGGLENTVTKLVKEDPEFVLGQAFALELNLMGLTDSPKVNPVLRSQLEAFNKLVDSKKAELNKQEIYHAEVVNLLADTKLKPAVRVLEELVTLYPEDVSTLKLIQDLNFYLGSQMPMRNSLASSLARMDDKNPFKSYTHGMYSFALEESNMYQQAQAEASKSLDLNPLDTWAIHNYAHCLEMLAKTGDGLKWMQDRKVDWEKCQILACHQYWHTALFHINNNQFAEAIDLLDNEILTRCKSNCSTLDLHDAASMIYRMELVDLFSKSAKNANGITSAGRWSGVYDTCKPHLGEHLLGFNDAHYMMSYLGHNDLASARELIDTITPEIEEANEGIRVAKPLLEAMYLYKSGAYDKCVELLHPIRFEIVKIGGSHAQRDIFEQLLLVAARKSERMEHNKLGERMLVEREMFHGSRVPQTELLAQA